MQRCHLMSFSQIETNFANCEVLNKERNYRGSTLSSLRFSLYFPRTLAYTRRYRQNVYNQMMKASWYESILPCRSKYLIITFHFSNILSLKSVNYSLADIFPSLLLFQNFKDNSFFQLRESGSLKLGTEVLGSIYS